MAIPISQLIFKIKKLRPIKLISLLIACTCFYFMGLLIDPRGTVNITKTTTTSSCTPRVTITAALDFKPHHYPPHPPPTAPEFHFPPCDPKYSEYTPCEDHKRSLKFDREKLVYRERHCPENKEVLKCRIPAPYGYKVPFRWPQSRDIVWYANVPHMDLTVEKKNQNWVLFKGDRFEFPGGGTMFPRGADHYIEEIGKLIDLENGSIRTAIDTGCGVASFGAYLLSRNIQTVSFAPKDSHTAQVQFALERGVPALIGVFASIRLPYPARAFDIAHCSRCLIPWAEYEGQYLIELDRILRPGGYWILSGPPINWEAHWVGWNRSIEEFKAEQTKIEMVAKSLCWQKIVQKDDIAVWQKPINHISCIENLKLLQNSQFCNSQNSDLGWYTKLENCITPLPQESVVTEIAGGPLVKWPERLTAIPPRISSGSLEGITGENFIQDTKLWKTRVAYYKKFDYRLAEPGRYRNLLDMNAYMGGFAAALVDDPVWVMNVVPVEAEVNTLGVIYERGLIGTYQNWCEAMSTYPRTYDFVHADSIFSLYKNRCEMEDIVLEMDRIMRPGGSVIIRDDVDVLMKVKKITDGVVWESRIVEHEKGPLEREKILFAVKQYWTLPASR